ncbi:MAG: GntR family transcriptional regulator [Bryobacterales bacterium]|nr:GntR family transcriptional regulator [Bryobacterales bacterium]
MEFTKIARRRATDEVYDALRQAILSHVFKPGERLQVEEIAEKLGVSITPVRHAIQQLSAEGLIQVHPRSGTYVTSLSPKDIEETFEIRRALECLAGELAVKRISGEQQAELRGLLRALALPVECSADRQRHEQDNQRFHALIIESSGNQKLSEMYAELNAHLQIARVHSANADWRSRLAQEQMEHEEIVAALEARDARRLVKALTAHIERAQRSLASIVSGGTA